MLPEFEFWWLSSSSLLLLLCLLLYCNNAETAHKYLLIAKTNTATKNNLVLIPCKVKWAMKFNLHLKVFCPMEINFKFPVWKTSWLAPHTLSISLKRLRIYYKFEYLWVLNWYKYKFKCVLVCTPCPICQNCLQSIYLPLLTWAG